MDKILSLIIPTYNMEKYLDKCLASLIIADKELMKHLEVLVIIDGATDSSSEIAHTYEARFPDIYKVIDKENGNYGSCINRGLRESTGKYVKVLDADDWFDTNIFENYLHKLLIVDVDLVLNDMHTVGTDKNGYMLYNITSFFESNIIYSFEEIFRVNLPRYIAMHCLAYRREKIIAMGYKQTEGISYTDVEWIFYPMTMVRTFTCIPGVLYQYLLGRQGQTMDPAIARRQSDQLAKMLLELVKRRISYGKQDIYDTYMKIMMQAHNYTLYSRSNDEKIRKNILIPYDKCVHSLSVKIFKEMFEWKVEAVRYVALFRNPWSILMKELFCHGYRTFITSFDYCSVNNLLHPVWIANCFYMIKNSIFRFKNKR